MDSLNSDGSGALALEPLCQAAAQELSMRSYTIRNLNRYKRVWEQLADFARAQVQPALYSRELALRFEKDFGLRDGEVLSKGQHWRRHLVFGIKVLDDFARTGTISRFVVETTGLRVPLRHDPDCRMPLLRPAGGTGAVPKRCRGGCAGRIPGHAGAHAV
jgi:hypothetical protein